MLLQIDTIPSPESIKDTVTALIWVVGVLMAALIALIFFVRTILNKQEVRYEAQITELKAELDEKDSELKEINKKVMDSIVPTMQNLNTALGTLIEQNRK